MVPTAQQSGPKWLMIQHPITSKGIEGSGEQLTVLGKGKRPEIIQKTFFSNRLRAVGILLQSERFGRKLGECLT